MTPQAGRKRTIAYRVVKRVMDIVGALFGIAITLPFFPIVWLLIRLDSPGPVFFRQERIGECGRPFLIWKFRTMTYGAPELVNADGSRHVAKNDARVTRSGRILRATSLDELPQLINILTGEMSLVGPRPDQPGGHGISPETLRRKHSVKPGLTSLASVNGRNSIPWSERVNWELRYVENASLALDLKILLRTFIVVFRRDGVYCPDVRGDHA